MKRANRLWIALLAALLATLPVVALAEDTALPDASPVLAEALDPEVPEAGEATLDHVFTGTGEDLVMLGAEDQIYEANDADADDMLTEAAASDFVIKDGVLVSYTGSRWNVTVPSGVTAIGDKAFAAISTLDEVKLPEGVTAIGDGAFSGCTNLMSINIPASVRTIGADAFNGCSRMEPITIPDGVTTIGARAFHDCSIYASVRNKLTIPASVTSIGDEAFYGYDGVYELTIAGNIQTLGKDVFRECSWLSKVTLPEGLTAIGAGMFQHCYELNEVVIPEGVTAIGDRAFDDISLLRDITIPASVVEIGENIVDEDDDFPPKLHVTCGSAAQKWARSDDGYRFPIEITGHAEGVPIPAVAATCTADGLTEGSRCPVCGDVLIEQKIVRATGHDYQTVKGYDATCTADGLTNGTVCSVCGDVRYAQEIIPARGHEVITISGSAPTYTTPGLTDGKYCHICGEVIEPQQEIPALRPSNEFHMSGNASLSVPVGVSVQIVLDNGLVAASYKSSNKKIARVDAGGFVTTRKRGKAKITVKLADGNAIKLSLKVTRNKIDYLDDKPTMSYIDYGQDIVLKSLEIVGTNKVVAEYWLIFKRLPSMKTTKFSYIQAEISAGGIPIVNGTARNIKVRTRGMTVKKFKVTFKGSAVLNTDINLQHVYGIYGEVDEENDFWLNFKY